MSMQMDADFKKNTEWYPFCLGGSTGRGVWGVSGPSGVSSPKSIRAIQIIKNTLLTYKKKFRVAIFVRVTAVMRIKLLRLKSDKNFPCDRGLSDNARK